MKFGGNIDYFLDVKQKYEDIDDDQSFDQTENESEKMIETLEVQAFHNGPERTSEHKHDYENQREYRDKGENLIPGCRPEPIFENRCQQTRKKDSAEQPRYQSRQRGEFAHEAAYRRAQGRDSQNHECYNVYCRNPRLCRLLYRFGVQDLSSSSCGDNSAKAAAPRIASIPMTAMLPDIPTSETMSAVSIGTILAIRRS